jgi:hypothetical protein
MTEPSDDGPSPAAPPPGEEDRSPATEPEPGDPYADYEPL